MRDLWAYPPSECRGVCWRPVALFHCSYPIYLSRHAWDSQCSEKMSCFLECEEETLPKTFSPTFRFLLVRRINQRRKLLENSLVAWDVASHRDAIGDRLLPFTQRVTSNPSSWPAGHNSARFDCCAEADEFSARPQSHHTRPVRLISRTFRPSVGHPSSGRCVAQDLNVLSMILFGGVPDWVLKKRRLERSLLVIVLPRAYRCSLHTSRWICLHSS